MKRVSGSSETAWKCQVIQCLHLLCAGDTNKNSLPHKKTVAGTNVGTGPYSRVNTEGTEPEVSQRLISCIQAEGK